MCEGSGLSAVLEYEKIPKLDCIQEYIDQGSMPGATRTNWKSVEENVTLSQLEWRSVLCDPQTSGGLLVAVEESSVEEVEKIFAVRGITGTAIGKLTVMEDKVIRVG